MLFITCTLLKHAFKNFFKPYRVSILNVKVQEYNLERVFVIKCQLIDISLLSLYLVHWRALSTWRHCCIFCCFNSPLLTELNTEGTLWGGAAAAAAAANELLVQNKCRESSVVVVFWSSHADEAEETYSAGVNITSVKWSAWKDAIVCL